MNETNLDYWGRVVAKTRELKGQTPTEQIEAWIEEHGSCRDALNVALARLEAAGQGVTPAVSEEDPRAAEIASQKLREDLEAE